MAMKSGGGSDDLNSEINVTPLVDVMPPASRRRAVNNDSGCAGSPVNRAKSEEQARWR